MEFMVIKVMKVVIMILLGDHWGERLRAQPDGGEPGGGPAADRRDGLEGGVEDRIDGLDGLDGLDDLDDLDDLHGLDFDRLEGDGGSLPASPYERAHRWFWDELGGGECQQREEGEEKLAGTSPTWTWG